MDDNDMRLLHLYDFVQFSINLGLLRNNFGLKLGIESRVVLTTYAWFSFYGTSNQLTKVFTGKSEPSELNPSVLYFCLLPTYHLFQTTVSLFYSHSRWKQV